MKLCPSSVRVVLTSFMNNFVTHPARSKIEGVFLIVEIVQNMVNNTENVFVFMKGMLTHVCTHMKHNTPPKTSLNDFNNFNLFSVFFKLTNNDE